MLRDALDRAHKKALALGERLYAPRSEAFGERLDEIIARHRNHAAMNRD